MKNVVCPRCGSKLRKSHSVGLKEKLLKISGKRAFRCRDKNCNWRGLIKIKTAREAILQTYGRYVVILLFLIILLGFSILLLFYIYGVLDHI